MKSISMIECTIICVPFPEPGPPSTNTTLGEKIACTLVVLFVSWTAFFDRTNKSDSAGA